MFVVLNVATISKAQPEQSIRSKEAGHVSWQPHVVLAVSPTLLGLLAKSGDLTKLK
jgi:hypothetical protein